MKRFISILLTLSLVCSMTACRKSDDPISAPPTSESEAEETAVVQETPETAFDYDHQAMNKSIDDFIGNTIVLDYGIGEDGNHNFIAYSPSTIPVDPEDGFNVVLSADYEQGLYTIVNPSQTLLQLKADDIFMLPPDIAGSHNGISGKVGTITVNNDHTITIQLAASELHELFSYINIDTVADFSSITYDETQLEEGMNISISGTSSQASISQAPDSDEEHYLINYNKSAATDIALTFSRGYDLSAYANKTNSSKSFSHSYNFSVDAHITSINVQMRYNADNDYFYSDVSLNWDKTESNALSFSGSWSNGKNGMGHTWPGLKGYIPYTPFIWRLEPFQLNELSGTFSGRLSYSESRVVGFCYEKNPAATNARGYNKLLGNSHTSSIELEGSLESSVGVRLKVGIPYTVEVFMDGAIGAGLSGKLEIMDSKGKGEEAEIHDCRKCIDGDISVFVKGNIGIDSEALSVMTDKDLVFRFATGTSSAKIGDFYASYRDESETNIECGMGECPYKRYKVTIRVLKDDGGPAKNAFVTATYPDGRAGGGVRADNNGIAIHYLPSGDNLVEGELTGLTGSVHVLVTDKPVETTLRLTETAPILILINQYQNAPWPELEDGLKEQYPAARIEYYEQFVPHSSDLLAIPTPGPCYTHFQDYDVAKGDIVLLISIANPQDLSTSTYEGTHYTYLDGNLYSEFVAFFYRVGQNNTYIQNCDYAFWGIQWGRDGLSDSIVDETSYDLSGVPLNYEQHTITFHNTTLDSHHNYNVYSPEPSYSVTYRPKTGIFDEYSTINTYLGNLGNIRKAQTDYVLGQIDLIMQLMIEGRDAEGYIPVYPYEIKYVSGDPEVFTEEFIKEHNEYLQEQAQAEAERESYDYDYGYNDAYSY